MRRLVRRTRGATVAVNADTDVVVVGGGPAGSAAALVLARAGRRVLLVDAHAFPRDKVCGDLVGTEAVATLRRLGIARTALGDALRLTGAVLVAPSGRRAGATLACDRTPRASDACVVSRFTFDARLLEAARDAGAAFARARVRGVLRARGGAVMGVSTDAGDVRARVTIAADGWGSAIARAISPARRCGDVAVVARTYLHGTHRLGNRMHFFVNDAGDGYGWLFPLATDLVNAGLGFIRREPGEGDVRAAFARFLGPASATAAFVTGDATAPVAAWPIPLGPPLGRVAAAGVLLTGDAAWLASPLSGSGIHHALASGAAAATFAQRALVGCDDAWRAYAAWIGRRMARRLTLERHIHRLAGTPTRIEPWLWCAQAIPGAQAALSRALLALG